MNLKEATTDELIQELRERAVVLIVWQPEDMEGFGDPDTDLSDRLAQCSRALEDRSIERGWDVIEAVLGYTEELK